jgi:hypothetical protein
VLVLTLGYTSDAGYPQKSRIAVRRDGWVSGRLSGCRIGCSLLTLGARGDAGTLVERVAVGHTELLSRPATVPAGGSGTLADVSTATDAAQQALVTPGIRLHRTVAGIDGTSPEVSVIGGVDALPLLGRYGSLMDLSRVLRGAVGTVAAGRSFVVARADTPTSVLATLHADGGGRPTSYGGALSTLAGTSQARGDALALLVSLGVALVALTHLGAWLAGQLSRRRSEAAGLRVAGFSSRAVRRAYRLEAMVLGLVVAIGSVIPAIATMNTLLRPMRLVGGWPEGPPVDLSLRPWVLVPSVVGTAAIAAIGCLLVFTRFGRSARPSALRSADR